MIGNEQSYIAAIAVLWWYSVFLCVCVVYTKTVCVQTMQWKCIEKSLQKPWRWSLSNLEWWCFGSHTASSSFPWTETGRETHLSRDLCASVVGIFGRDEPTANNPFQEKAPKGFVCFFFVKNSFKGWFYFIFVKKVKVNLLRYFSYVFFSFKRLFETKEGNWAQKLETWKALIRNGPKNLKSHGGVYYFQQLETTRDPALCNSGVTKRRQQPFQPFPGFVYRTSMGCGHWTTQGGGLWFCIERGGIGIDSSTLQAIETHSTWCYSSTFAVGKTLGSRGWNMVK